MIDWGTLAVAAIMAGSNFGGLALLGKRYAERVDRHDEAIPKMVGTMDALNEAAKSTSKCLDELYASRNDLKNGLTQVKERQRAQRDLCDERYTSESHPKRRVTDWQDP